MVVVRAEGIVGNGNVFVRMGDGLHFFPASLVREKPVSRRAVSPKALYADRHNGVRLVDEKGKVTLVED